MAVGLAAALVLCTPREPAGGQFAAATDLVEVYVSVTDPSGRPAEGLSRDDFQVSEDGIAQTISVFSAGDFPLSLAIVVDRSFSMAGRPLEAALAGADRLIAEAGGPDRVTVVALGGDVQTLAPLGSDPDAARRALRGLSVWGTTPLGEAVNTALGVLAGQAGRRAVVLFTDGRGRYDPADREALLERVRRSDVLVYPMAVGRQDPRLLADLAALSGGRASRARNARQATQLASRLAAELRHQYLIGYEPTGTGPGGWRTIHVTVGRPRLSVRARRGYFRSSSPARESPRPPAASKLPGMSQ
jgi:Ca-activated chloride channel homolog